MVKLYHIEMIAAADALYYSADGEPPPRLELNEILWDFDESPEIVSVIDVTDNPTRFTYGDCIEIYGTTLSFKEVLEELEAQVIAKSTHVWLRLPQPVPDEAYKWLNEAGDAVAALVDESTGLSRGLWDTRKAFKVEPSQWFPVQASLL